MVKDFCANEGYNRSLFYDWRSRFNISDEGLKPGSVPTAGMDGFVPISIDNNNVSAPTFQSKPALCPQKTEKPSGKCTDNSEISLELPNRIKMKFKGTGGCKAALSLLTKLSQHVFRKCRYDMERIRERLEEEDQLFRDEMMGHLLTAHILDLYDIHARGQEARQIPERAAKLINRFIGMLYDGSYVVNRNFEYYASCLCITPHYLTEISKKVSGRPATWWIDRFTLHKIVRLIHRKELSVAEIAERLHFSSLSYFSRYVQKRLGTSSSAYRSELPKN